MMRNEAPMNRISKISALAGLALTALALGAGAAHAQLASGKGPIDVTANQSEFIDAQHLSIWSGDVQAVQNGDRLTCDVLNIYMSGKPSATPGSPPAPAPAAGTAGDAGGDWGDVERMVADGHVFYFAADKTARGDHAVYEAAQDLITMTGNVVVVQGKNVAKGDKLVIEVKTNHAVLTSIAQGRNRPERVRAVIFNAHTAGSSNTAATPAPSARPAAAAVKP